MIKTLDNKIKNFDVVLDKLLFTRRAKIGTIHRSRISGLDNILTDFRYAGSIGLLLHEDDLRKDIDVIPNRDNGVMGKLKKWTQGGF